jgi:hypothetical protein
LPRPALECGIVEGAGGAPARPDERRAERLSAGS